MAEEEFNPITYAASKIREFDAHSQLAVVLNQLRRSPTEEIDNIQLTRAVIDRLARLQYDAKPFTPQDMWHALSGKKEDVPAERMEICTLWSDKIDAALQRFETVRRIDIREGSALSRIEAEVPAALREDFLLVLKTPHYSWVRREPVTREELTTIFPERDLDAKLAETNEAIRRSHLFHPHYSGSRLASIQEAAFRNVTGEYAPRFSEDLNVLVCDHLPYGSPKITENEMRDLFAAARPGRQEYDGHEIARRTAQINDAIDEHVAIHDTDQGLFDAELAKRGGDEAVIELYKFHLSIRGDDKYREDAETRLLQLAAEHLGTHPKILSPGRAKSFLEGIQTEGQPEVTDDEAKAWAKDFNDGVREIRDYRQDWGKRAAANIANPYQNGAIIFMRNPRAIEREAKAGNAAAQFAMGLARQNGWDNQPANLTDAYEWYKKAAGQEHIGGTVGMAMLLRTGFDGTPANADDVWGLLRSVTKQPRPTGNNNPMGIYYDLAVYALKHKQAIDDPNTDLKLGFIARYLPDRIARHMQGVGDESGPVQQLWKQLARKATGTTSTDPVAAPARIKKSLGRRLIRVATAAVVFVGASGLVTNRISPDLRPSPLAQPAERQAAVVDFRSFENAKQLETAFWSVLNQDGKVAFVDGNERFELQKRGDNKFHLIHPGMKMDFGSDEKDIVHNTAVFLTKKTNGNRWYVFQDWVAAIRQNKSFDFPVWTKNYGTPKAMQSSMRPEPRNYAARAEKYAKT